MNRGDDWARWGEDWQQQNVVDVDRLRRRVQRKLWQMRAMVVVEALIALVAVGQLTRLFFMPQVSGRWKIWAGLALLLIGVMVWLSLHVRRRTWHATTASVPDLLRLTANRARAGIQLAWASIVGFLLLIAITVPIAAPWLAPSRWLHDPKLQVLLLLQIGINGLVCAALLIFFALYIRRQRRRLRMAEALLREYADNGSRLSPG